jgi:CBS domain containing-hemolysin-like protein
MIENALGYLLILVGLGAAMLQRLYSSIPAHELKRLASRGDQLAGRLYRVVAYGVSLRLLLWMIVGVSIPVGLLLVLPGLPTLAALATLVAVAVLGFVALPSMLLTQRTAQVAAQATPVLAWILLHTHTLLDRLARAANRFRDLPLHSRMYEKEDLIELLARQRKQVDNRIQESDLELVHRALRFDDTLAADLVQPRKKAHLVNADDSIGPILLDQLHQQKQQSFLVYKDSKENIIGSLALSDAVTAKKGGRVFDLIRSDLIYVHEDFTARQVMNTFHKTGHQVAVVINNAEEFIGVITLDHLLHDLLGEASEESIAYGDRSAVASYRPHAEEKAEPMPDAADAPSDSQAEAPGSKDTSSAEATEVVE